MNKKLPLVDFGEACKEWIKEDGELDPKPIFCVRESTSRFLYYDDPDGVLCSAKVPGIDGKPCLISVLVRHSAFPKIPTVIVGELFYPGLHFIVLRKIDSVVGRGGESYARFEVGLVDEHGVKEFNMENVFGY